MLGERTHPDLHATRITGSEKMKESFMLQRIRGEGELAAKRQWLLDILRIRFQTAPPSCLASTVNAVEDVAALGTLLDLAVTCADVYAFWAGLDSLTAGARTPHTANARRSRP